VTLTAKTAALVALALGIAATEARGQDAALPGALPAHPRELRFPELSFDPPAAEPRRLELPNGLVAYLVPDALLPVVRVRAYVRTGSVYDPPGKEGLASLVFATIRVAGAGDLGPDALSEQLDALAATIEGEAGDLRATVEAWTHARRLDRVLALFADVLRRPRFDAERFERTRDDAANDAKTDEDDAKRVASARLRRAVYGDHPFGRSRTADSIEKLTVKDASAFHKKYVTPGRIVLAVSGAFDEKAMREKIAALFSDWNAEGSGFAELPAVVPGAGGSIRVVARSDMTQGHVELARLSIKVGDRDEYPLTLADHILGAGSFTSRVVARVRGDEGLAYSCESSFDETPVVPGLARITYQSRAPETAHALALVFEEARGLASSGPTKDELEAAKAAVIGRLPSRFATAADVARALAESELDGYPKDYYTRYRERIAGCSADDVKAAAKKYFEPDGMAVVVVGPEDKVRESPAHGSSLDALGKVIVEKSAAGGGE
jgi:zinc protease